MEVETTAPAPAPPPLFHDPLLHPEKTLEPKHRQKAKELIQKRKMPGHDAVDQDPESSDGRGDHGVFFQSRWDDALSDPHTRHLLQPLLGIKQRRLPRQTSNCRTSIAPQATACPDRDGESNSPSAEMQTTDSHAAEAHEGEEESGASEGQLAMEYATESEMDAILCKMQFETNQDLRAMVHALYYCSGNAAMATAFLKGESPPGMWSSEDDLLLVTLMAEDSSRSAVAVAMARGDFASMQTMRDADEIVARIHFLL